MRSVQKEHFFLQFANNAYQDQPAHQRKPIWTFIVRLMYQWVL